MRARRSTHVAIGDARGQVAITTDVIWKSREGKREINIDLFNGQFIQYFAVVTINRVVSDDWWLAVARQQVVQSLYSL